MSMLVDPRHMPWTDAGQAAFVASMRLKIGVELGRMSDGDIDWCSRDLPAEWLRTAARAEILRREALS